MTIHELKILPEHFIYVSAGLKTAEIRLNDRNYKVGDKLLLKEWDNKYTGKAVQVTITHILHDFKGLDPNYVSISFKRF